MLSLILSENPAILKLPWRNLLDLLEKKPEKLTWPPYELGGRSSGALVTDIKINFFNGEHNVLYSYSKLTGTYGRENGYDVSGANPRNILILEMPIDWYHEPSSKISPFADSMQMVKDTVLARWRGVTGTYE